MISMLIDIEKAFRSMVKSELGLRPVYHQKERRVDGHLFITVLAHHVLRVIRFKLGKRGMTQSWSTIRSNPPPPRGEESVGEREGASDL